MLITQVYEIQPIVRILYMLAFWQGDLEKINCAGFWRRIVREKNCHCPGLCVVLINQISISSVLAKSYTKEILHWWNVVKSFSLVVQIQLTIVSCFGLLVWPTLMDKIMLRDTTIFDTREWNPITVNCFPTEINSFCKSVPHFFVLFSKKYLAWIFIY